MIVNERFQVEENSIEQVDSSSSDTFILSCDVSLRIE